MAIGTNRGTNFYFLFFLMGIIPSIYNTFKEHQFISSQSVLETDVLPTELYPYKGAFSSKYIISKFN